MSEDLATFLRARLDEDEALATVARDANTGVFASIGDADWHLVPGEGIWTDDHGIQVATGGIGLGDNEGAHIARHDPARVLREVEAKRNLVDSAAGAQHDRDYWRAQLPSDSVDLLKTVAAMEARWSAWHYVLTQLAASYVDHPDYQPELIVPW
ncbi:DUF6221 family protein [Streptomyces sp. NPDC003300]|uniref:DUF6221 family protein n=1 Tax=unclassified Streptomyces TaxID=2593676 RepID=UPI0033B4017A